MRWLLALSVMVRVAQADPAAEVTKAFQAFVEHGGANEPGLGLFIPPGEDGPADGDFVWPATPPDASYVFDYLKSPKLAVRKLVVSPSGSSAWLAGEIKNADKAHPTLRASAMLVKDDKGWHVRATHWSLPKKDQIVDVGCGAVSYEWHMKPGVPADVRAPLNDVLKAFSYSGKVAPVLSDDKNAQLFGSAPGETYTGGAAVKKIFSKWHVSADSSPDADPLNATGGIAPDGQLMWLSFGVGGPDRVCTMYRASFILAKEKLGWRIVEQHYSRPVFL